MSTRTAPPDNSAHAVLALNQVDDLDELQELILHRSVVLYDMLDGQQEDEKRRRGVDCPMATVTREALTELAGDIIHAAERLEQILEAAKKSSGRRHAAKRRTKARHAAREAFLGQPPAGSVQ